MSTISTSSADFLSAFFPRAVYTLLCCAAHVFTQIFLSSAWGSLPEGNYDFGNNSNSDIAVAKDVEMICWSVSGLTFEYMWFNLRLIVFHKRHYQMWQLCCLAFAISWSRCLFFPFVMCLPPTEPSSSFDVGDTSGFDDGLRRRNVPSFEAARPRTSDEDEEEEEVEFKLAEKKEEKPWLSMNKCIVGALILLFLGSLFLSGEFLLVGFCFSWWEQQH